MPTYTFINLDTNEEHTIFLKMAEREEYIRTHNVLQVPCALNIHSGMGLGAQKHDEGWKDLLRTIKAKNSKGLTKSTINVPN
jgi:hypothetical protein